ncbi:MAG: 2OG-Fe(II) oxygenase [Bacteroidota bacterium]|nr:2OG-Fe(II) oxygenase [Bacteroidota bacterium]MDP4215212.1 2OG-Fe(II) oxygenase [Bacteroidota bacterium]MDP4247710.1 2OG-Fe(II) oxygenase [Bacteroidota bacterium]MDP4254553.1 2OG-Fe(II) oxygenase [Bacteroidota bacterium]MDP4260007.1 2OG-Fe(II) oxygenase [Bacteroidota bacterium]
MKTQTQIFDYAAWNDRLPELSKRYQSASPYPHIVLENFLDPDTLDECIGEFNKLNETDGWINYKHYNEKKRGLNKLDILPETIKETINELNSPEFLDFLSALTGIKGLMKDDYLEGGGIHQSGRGGFLNIHADFTVHPHHRNWQRRVNVLVYLNKGWKEEWGGKLELWDKKMNACEEKVLPVFNRCVIFNTDADSFHGHPEPMTCPEDRFRRSIALYYYTEEDKPFRRATYYQARPGEGKKKLFVKLDNAMVALYTNIKGKLGANDKFVSGLLRFFSGRKK